MPHGLARKLTYSDLPPEPTDGRRYELIRGRLFVNPSPNTIHQLISMRLSVTLYGYFETRGHRVFQAPTDVILTPGDVFIPDIVVAALDDITIRGIERPPLIAVEILSPSTRRNDLRLKKTRYAELGIPHYWIVDPGERWVECHRLERRRYASLLGVASDGVLTHPEFDGLTIDVGALWTQLPGEDQSSAS
ncbi:MAG TPA: Uma2 family endonuclease [Candidatus Polarisedimenticolaceae bacterium]|nr:Uma2 family endonuclease [Candidatus Polarisedimenticolaceae bacterium]